MNFSKSKTLTYTFYSIQLKFSWNIFLFTLVNRKGKVKCVAIAYPKNHCQQMRKERKERRKKIISIFALLIPFHFSTKRFEDMRNMYCGLNLFLLSSISTTIWELNDKGNFLCEHEKLSSVYNLPVELNIHNAITFFAFFFSFFFIFFRYWNFSPSLYGSWRARFQFCIEYEQKI